MKRSVFAWLFLFPLTASLASFLGAQHDHGAHGAGGHQGHSAPAVVAPAAESQSAFEKILDQYYRIHDALANDTTDGVEKAAQKITKLASEAEKQSPEKQPDFGAISQAAAGLGGKGLKQAREQFGELSKPIIAELKRDPSFRKSGFAYSCSMANKSWVQGKKEIRNPYYGKSMLKCGEPL